MKFKKLLALLMALALVLTSFSFAAATEDGADIQEGSVAAVDGLKTYSVTAKHGFLPAGGVLTVGAEIASKDIDPVTGLIEDIAVPTIPSGYESADGFTAIGWFLENADKSLTAITKLSEKEFAQADATIYYIWEPYVVTVTYTAPDAVPAYTTETKTIPYGAAVPAPANLPKKTGNQMKSAWLNAAGGEVVTETTKATTASGVVLKASDKTGALTLTAQWTPDTFTVTFVPGAGADAVTNMPETQEPTYGEKLVAVSTPSWVGHTFDGWKDGGGHVFDVATTAVTSNLVLTAQWKDLILKVKAFASREEAEKESGTPASTQDVVYNNPIIKPADPVQEGSSVVGWEVQIKDGDTYSYADWTDWTTKITEDTVLVAKWSTNSYAVTFNAGEGKFADKTSTKVVNVEYDTAIGSQYPDDPARVGYTFKGWERTLDGDAKEEVTKDTVVKEVFTANAVWEKKEYTIKMDTGAVSATWEDLDHKDVPIPAQLPKTVAYGDNLKKSQENNINDVVKTEDKHYTFVTWTYKDKDGEVQEYSTATGLELDAANVLIADDDSVTLTAKWNEFYIINYTNAHATDPIEPHRVLKAEDAKLSEADVALPTFAGSVCKGWFAEGATEAAKKGDAITGDLSLTAKWVKKFVVSFILDGGAFDPDAKFDNVDAKTIFLETENDAEGVTTTFKANKKKLPDATKEGNTLEGWFVGSTKYDENTAISADTVLQAHWKPVEYTVTFDYDIPGEANVVKTVAYNATVTPPQDKTNGTKINDGWHEVLPDGSLIPAVFTGIKANKTFKVKWTDAVAQIGETNYPSLDDAITAANASTSTNITVKLLANTSIADDLTITKAITLDLNQKELDLGGSELTASAAVTIKNGTMKNGDLTSNGVTVSIESGTYVAMKYNVEDAASKIVLKGGFYDDDAIIDGGAGKEASLEDAGKMLAKTEESGTYYTPVGYKTLSFVFSATGSGAADGTKVIKVADGTVTKNYAEYLNETNATAFATAIAAKETAGYHYTEKWLKDGKEFTFGSALTANTVINCEWELIVTFDANGGQFSDGSTKIQQYVKAGERATVPEENPTKTNYSFASTWVNVANETAWDFKTKVNEPLTLKASWIHGESSWDVCGVDSTAADGYTYDGANRVLTYGDEKTITLTQKNAAYNFIFTLEAPEELTAANQWLLRRNGASWQDAYSLIDMDTATVPEPKKSENGNFIITIEEKADPDLLKDQTEITYIYEMVAGKEKKPATGAEITKITMKVIPKNVIYQAPGVPNPSKEFVIKDFRYIFNITWVDADSLKNLPATVESGETITKPADPEKEGAVFHDWYEVNDDNYDADGNIKKNEAGVIIAVPFDFTTKIFDDITIKAEYDEAVTVTFIDGDKLIQTSTVKKDSVTTITAPAAPTKEVGMMFVRWTDGENSLEPGDLIPTTKSMDLYAEWTVDPAAFTGILEGATVNFRGQLSIGMKFKWSKAVNNFNGWTVVFTKGGVSKAIPFADGSVASVENKEYVYYYPVPIPQFDQKVTITIKDPDGNVMPFNDEMATSETVHTVIDSFVYSIEDYATSGKGSETMKKLKAALEVYGKAAANMFEGGSYSPIDVSTADFAGIGEKTETGTLPEGLTLVGVTVNFSTDNSLKFVFELQSGYELKDFTFKVDGTPKTPTKYNGSATRYELVVPNIEAPNLANTHTFSVDKYTMTTSALIYAKSRAEKSNDANMVTLAKALYLYYLAAKAQF